MTEKDTTILKQYTNPLSRSIQEQYAISPDHYRGDIKLGLRNNDGTGVLVGVSKVGSVQGYLMQDGQRVPAPGKLYYRGIELTDIVEAHRKAGTFGFEEVAYLLLMGYLPSKSELAYFDKIMNQARKLPEGFTEGMIMRHPSHNIMNELARSVLSLYSYDPDPDNTSIDNMLLQSVKLVGYFPSIVANAYAVQRHYFHGDSLHIHFPVPELSTAENFLRMMRPDKSYTDEEAHLLDMMLMVHAEHGGGNNSTFVCRAMSSSGTDTYSAIAGAVGSLKGPLHGGANAKVMEMFRYIKENVDPHDDGSIKDYLNKLLDGQAGDRSGKIYGLGHAVYTMSDPRAVLLKKYAQRMAELKGYADELEGAEDFTSAAIALIKRTIRDHRRVIFNGNGYTAEWEEEAARRGLPNKKNTPAALPALIDPKNIQLMEDFGVLTKIEMESRYEVEMEHYSKIINIEALTMLEMARKQLLPAINAYMSEVANTAASKLAVSEAISVRSETKTLTRLSTDADAMSDAIDALQAAVDTAEAMTDESAKAVSFHDDVLPKMDALRAAADDAETICGEDYWPLPSYSKMLYYV